MVRVAIALVMLLLPTAAWAQAEKRIALLIGNQSYKPGVGALVNPLNDTRVVGEALKAVGFEVLKPVHNARRAGMLVAIHEFAAKLKAAGSNAVGFLYYSGHGIASAGDNYLMPVDLDEPSTVQLRVQGVKHSEVLTILRNEAPNAAHYLVLDACRNTLQGTRGGKGFVPLGQQSGVLVAFAAEPGKTASDTGQGSGPYAAALAAELVKPGQNDLLMFHNVRVAVMDKTRGDQVPWTEDGIQRRQRVLFGGEPSATKPAPALRPTQLDRSEMERAAAFIKDTEDQVRLEAFIRQFGDSAYAPMARARLQELKDKQAAIAAPPKRLPEKREHAFDGTWAVTTVTGKGCPNPGTRREREYTIRIRDSKIEESGSAAGRVSTEGDFEYVVSRKFTGSGQVRDPRDRNIVRGGLQVESGQGTFGWLKRGVEPGCSGSVFLKRL